MKKILIILSICVFTSAFAATNSSMPIPQNNATMSRMDPECKPMWDTIRQSHPKLEGAIKANDANTVGKIIIANHNYVESFILNHPQCDMHHQMNGSM